MNTAALTPAVESTAESRLQLKRDVSTISTVGIAHGTSHFFHLLLAAPLFPFLQDAFGVSNVQLGLLMSVFFVVSATVQATSGFVVDKFGATRVLFFGLSCFVLAAWLAAASPVFALLYLCAGLAGMGNGVFHPVDFSILNARVSKPRLGHAFSVHGISGNLGWAAAPLVLGGTAAFAGWRVALVVAGCIALAVILFLLLQRDHLDDSSLRSQREAVKADAAAGGPSAFAFMRNPAVWLCWSFFLLSTMALAAIQSFGPAVAVSEYGFSKELAASIITVYMVVSAFGMVLGGWVVSRFERYDSVIAAALALSAIAALLIALKVFPGASLLVLLAVMGFGVGVAGPSRDLLIRQSAAKGALGRVYGVVYSGLDVGFVVGPVLFGWLLDHGRVNAIFACVAVFQALAIFTAWRVGQGARRTA
jgi:MFS transporter, FSR family, fosmidomycin resistance protein